MSNISNKLLNWYDKNKRDLPWRDIKDPYGIWVSEIMLQQTQVTTVIPYYDRFMTALPTIADLAQASEAQLHKLWEGLGYYRRVQYMHRAAQILVAEYGGKLPTTRDELIKLPGIGPYTAGAIASMAFGEAVSAIDGNVLRIYSRLHEIDTPIERVVTTSLVNKKVMDDMDPTRPGDFNQALMDLGSRICIPLGPKCSECPLNKDCKGHLNGTAEDYPVRLPKKARRKESYTILVLYQDGKIYLTRRPDEGLLARLWSFPMMKNFKSPSEVEEYLKNQGLQVHRIEKLPSSTHLFSHIEWDMIGYAADVRSLSVNEGDEGVWITPAMMEQNYSIPTAYKTYVEEVKNHGMD